MEKGKLLFKSPLINEKKEKIKETIDDIKMLIKCFLIGLVLVLAFFGAMDILQNLE